MKTFKQLTEVSAFDFVRQKLEKEHGKENIITKDNPRKPQTPAEKAKFVLIKQKLMPKMLQNVRKTHHRVVIPRVNNGSTS